MIQKAVYSLWTKPTGNTLYSAGNWFRPIDQFLFLSMSVIESAKRFKKVELVTDNDGWEIIKKLDLPFTSVSLELEKIEKKYLSFWALGKIFAYRIQSEPFIHIDNDAVFFKEVPNRILNADLIVQSSEKNEIFESYYSYHIKTGSSKLKNRFELWGDFRESINCGVFGGNDMDFIQRYCNKSIDFVMDNDWSSIPDSRRFSVIFEQYLLCCMAKFENRAFEFLDEESNDLNLTKMGFTHLIEHKKDPSMSKRIETRLRSQYPDAFEKVIALYN